MPLGHAVRMLECVWVDLCLPMSCPCLLPFLATVKKSIRLREEMQAKEPAVKASNSQISAEKLRKILKEEKR